MYKKDFIKFVVDTGILISNYKELQYEEIIYLYNRDIEKNKQFKIVEKSENNILLFSKPNNNDKAKWDIEKYITLRPQINLTVDDMIEYNELAEKLIKKEAFYGIKDKEGLESILALMNQNTFGRDYHPTLIDKATYLWFTIATKQYFRNGNKRTAMISAIIFLRVNCLDFDVKDEIQLYNKTVEVAEKKISEQDLYNYVKKHTFINMDRQKKELYNIFWPMIKEDNDYE